MATETDRRRPDGRRGAERRAATLLAALLVLAPCAARGDGLDLDLYDALLQRHVRAAPDATRTRVDYAALRASGDWRRLVSGLASARPDEIDGPRARLAFWIDAYNVLAIDLVVRHYPVSSIRDVGSLFRPVWKREAGRLGGPEGPGTRPVTLDEIEHGILRKLGEPRIHAAIVCASISCPPLRREAYRAARLDAQLDDNLRAFLADPDHGARLEGGTLRLSAIFDWFAKDFAAAGGVLAFVRPYLPEPMRAALARAPAPPALAYFDYDWRLNDTSER